MGTRDPRVDRYISRAAPFARPVLEYLREVVHGASEQIDEDIKWGMPHFVHRGIVCGMAAFKEHCTLAFRNPEALGIEIPPGAGRAMGQFGRITTIDDLPTKRTLTAYVRKTVRNNAAGVRPAKPAARPTPPAVPPALKRALAADGKARAGFDGLSPSQQRDYVEWIAEAKRDETRNRRLDTTMAWLREGKDRNWKYRR